MNMSLTPGPIADNRRQHPLYIVWKGMRSRCFSLGHASYENYGGRGIRPCKEWDDYFAFYEWATENGYVHGLSLDRIDNNGPYSPSNCRWVTYKVQANNTRGNLRVVAFGEEKPVSEWADDIRCAVPVNTLYQRLENGWNTETAILLPSKRMSTALPITFDQYQAVAEATAIYPDQGNTAGLVYVVLGLGGEVGEIQNKVKKVLRDTNGILSPERRRELIGELSDVLWYVAMVASELGMSLGSIAESNLEKLHSRAERGVIKGEGDKR